MVRESEMTIEDETKIPSWISGRPTQWAVVKFSQFCLVVRWEDCSVLEEFNVSKLAVNRAGGCVAEHFEDEQWCKQDQILKKKTKTTVSKQKHLADVTLSKWTPLRCSQNRAQISQNRDTINSTWKVYVSFTIIMVASVRRPCFTTQHQTCKTKTKTTGCKTKTAACKTNSKTKTDLLWSHSDRSCPKTDGLRPHHRRWVTDESTSAEWKERKSSVSSAYRWWLRKEMQWGYWDEMCTWCLRRR